MKYRKKSLTKRFILFLCLICAILAYSAVPALKDVFKDYYLIGVAVNSDQISGKDTSATILIEKHFNSVTPENILKWQFVHPKPDTYRFEPVDQLVALAEKNNMFVVGHTLVWHNQTPRWVFTGEAGNPVDRETLLQRMKDHIFTVVGRYKGRIQGWDVINEALDDNGQHTENRWSNILGEDYILKAFEFAHEADPDAELYYNDFNMWKTGKCQGVVQLVRDLQSKGLRIDGVGMQGHWGMDYPDLAETDACISAYADLGIKVMITEMDVNILPLPSDYRGADINQNYELYKKLNPYPESLPDSMQTILADRYAEFFMLFNKHRDTISRVTLWGLSDGQSWLNFWPVRGRTNYPLLFDRQYQPKPAFYAVIHTVDEKQ